MVNTKTDGSPLQVGVDLERCEDKKYGEIFDGMQSSAITQCSFKKLLPYV